MLIILLMIFMAGIFLGLLLLSLLSLGREAKEWADLKRGAILAADNYYHDPMPRKIKKIIRIPR